MFTKKLISFFLIINDKYKSSRYPKLIYLKNVFSHPMWPQSQQGDWSGFKTRGQQGRQQSQLLVYSLNSFGYTLQCRFPGCIYQSTNICSAGYIFSVDSSKQSSAGHGINPVPSRPVPVPGRDGTGQ